MLHDVRAIGPAELGALGAYALDSLDDGADEGRIAVGIFLALRELLTLLTELLIPFDSALRAAGDLVAEIPALEALIASVALPELVDDELVDLYLVVVHSGIPILVGVVQTYVERHSVFFREAAEHIYEVY